MKYLMLLLLLVSVRIHAQPTQNIFLAPGRMFALKMNTMETNEFGKVCEKDTTVIWGTNYGDTTCFMFNGMIKCFWKVSEQTWRNEEDDDLRRSARKDTHVHVLQDRFNEKYSIRFVAGPTGLIIFISNIDFGNPCYIFRWCSRVGDECRLCD